MTISKGKSQHNILLVTETINRLNAFYWDDFLETPIFGRKSKIINRLVENYVSNMEAYVEFEKKPSLDIIVEYDIDYLEIQKKGKWIGFYSTKTSLNLWGSTITLTEFELDYITTRIESFKNRIKLNGN